MLNQLIHPLLSLHGTPAYVLVGALCFAESALFIGFLVPGETAILYGGVLASEHHVSLVGMIVLAVLCATGGYIVGYEIGRRFGPLLLTHRPLKDRPAVERTTAIVQRRGAPAVGLGRFIPVVRALVPGIAGLSHVDYKKFLVANLGAGTVWAAGWTLAGYGVGSAYNKLLSTASWISEVVLGLVVVLIAVHVARSVRRHRRAESRPTRSTIQPATAIVDEPTESLN